FRRNCIWDKYRLWEARVRAHFSRRGAPTASESRALTRERRRPIARRSRNPGDDAVAGQRLGERTERRAAACRGNAVPDVERESAPCHSVARLGMTGRSEEHTSELQSHLKIVCTLLPEKNNNGENPT